MSKKKRLNIVFLRRRSRSKEYAEPSKRRRQQTTMRREWAFQIPPLHPKTKAVQWTAFSFLERCVPQAERDAHCVRDDGFAL